MKNGGGGVFHAHIAASQTRMIVFVEGNTQAPFSKHTLEHVAQIQMDSLCITVLL